MVPVTQEVLAIININAAKLPKSNGVTNAPTIPSDPLIIFSVWNMHGKRQAKIVIS